MISTSFERIGTSCFPIFDYDITTSLLIIGFVDKITSNKRYQRGK